MGFFSALLSQLKMHRHKPYRSKVFYTSTLTYAHSCLAKTTLHIALLIFLAFSSNKTRQISSCSQQNVVNNKENMNTAFCCLLQKNRQESRSYHHHSSITLTCLTSVISVGILTHLRFTTIFKRLPLF